MSSRPSLGTSDVDRRRRAARRRRRRGGANNRRQGTSAPVLLVVKLNRNRIFLVASSQPPSSTRCSRRSASAGRQSTGIRAISSRPSPPTTPVAPAPLRQFGEYEWQRQRRGARDRLGDADAALKRIVFVGGDCDSDPLNRVLASARRVPNHPAPTCSAQVTIFAADHASRRVDRPLQRQNPKQQRRQMDSGPLG